MALLKHNNNSISNVTSFPLVPSGSPTLLATATASSSASLSFDSTYINGDYQIYKFEFIDIEPRTNSMRFGFNLSTDGGSNYNVTKTSTAFLSYHDEADTGTSVSYQATEDLAQSTADQTISAGGVGGVSGGETDECLAGSMSLFNPSSLVFVKHFISTSQFLQSSDYTHNAYVAGYGNTTSAINAIQFKFASGNMDGTIKLYGLGAN